MQPTHFMNLLVLCLLAVWLPCAHGAYVQWKDCEAGLFGEFAPELLSARLEQSDTTTRLGLEVVYVYDGSEPCQAMPNGPTEVILDLDMLGSSRRYQVAPSAVNRTCALPAKYKPQTSLSRRTEIYFAMSQDIGSLYPLSTFAIDLHLKQNQSEDLGCISANITPEISEHISGALRYGPVAIFLIVLSALATSMCGVSTSVDAETGETVPRSVLPVFGDCLQYLQFIFFTGSLTLSYPGFFQPVVSHYSWAALFSPIGPVNHGFTYPSTVDGIYEINGTFTGSYGFEVMAQVVGAPATMDVWLNMVILMIAIAVTAAVLVQIGSLIPRVRESFSDSVNDSTRISRIQHNIWTILKVIFSYFLLPIIAISAYQISNSRILPLYHLSLATILIAIMVVSFSWLAKQVPTRQLGTLILADSKRYHRLSSDRDANTFVLILFSLTFARGATIGGLQVSALAQVVLLGTFEIFLLAMIAILRPFQFLSVFTLSTAVRAIVVLLSSAFLPGLNTTTSTKSLVGYIILLLHAAVLILCFLLPELYRLGRLVFTKRTSAEEPRIYGLRELRRRGNALSSLSQLSNPISHPHHESVNTLNLSIDTSRSRSPDVVYLHETSQYFRPPRSRASSSHLNASGMSVSPISPATPATATRPTSVNIIVTSPKEMRPESPRMSLILTISSDSQDNTQLSDCSSQSKPLASRWSDYTFREADLYYGQPRRADTERAEQAPEVLGRRPSIFSSAFRAWKKLIGKKDEVGFQVVRPARPSGQGMNVLR